MIIKSISIKEQKQDRNGKWYRPCVAEFEGETGSYWHNIYLSTDVVALWQVGDEVQAKLKNDGKWKNFDPIIEKGIKAQPTPQTSQPDVFAMLRQISAQIDGLRNWMEMEKERNDRKNEGIAPF